MRQLPKPAAVALTVFLLAMACCGPGTLFFASQPGQVLYHRYVKDNRPSAVPCDELPSAADAKRALDENADLVRRIENTGDVDVSVDRSLTDGSCEESEHAEIVVSHRTAAQRSEIEKILTDEDFGDVPVSLRSG